MSDCIIQQCLKNIEQFNEQTANLILKFSQCTIDDFLNEFNNYAKIQFCEDDDALYYICFNFKLHHAILKTFTPKELEHFWYDLVNESILTSGAVHLTSQNSIELSIFINSTEFTHDIIKNSDNFTKYIEEWLTNFIKSPFDTDEVILNPNFLPKLHKFLYDKLLEFFEKRKLLRNNFIQKINTLSFEEMILALDENDIIYIKDYQFGINTIGEYIGFEVSHSWFGKYYKVEISQSQFVSNDTISKINNKITVHKFSDQQPINKLQIQLINDEEKQQLIKKNKNFLQILQKSFYLQYNGIGYYPDVWFGYLKLSAIGRCVIDINSYCKFNPNTSITNQISEIKNKKGQDIRNISNLNDNMLITLQPLIPGYSLVLKKWLLFNFNQLTNIEFIPNVFNKLELDPIIKQYLIKICEHKNRFNDLIYNKNGGQIILLCGETGTGKTLTAETLSESKQVPLYSITCGELGTDIESMEENLQNILELGQLWNAIILIDEADIFLEKRNSQSDLLRNAVVSLFLRKLEYFNGIMFLTSNRKDVIDPAVLCRTTCCLEYGKLTNKSKKQIWKNLLSYQNVKVNISELEYDKLSTLPINGRQIKNIIKNTLWINDDNDNEITYKKLIDVHKFCQFQINNEK